MCMSLCIALVFVVLFSSIVFFFCIGSLSFRLVCMCIVIATSAAFA